MSHRVWPFSFFLKFSYVEKGKNSICKHFTQLIYYSFQIRDKLILLWLIYGNGFQPGMTLLPREYLHIWDTFDCHAVGRCVLLVFPGWTSKDCYVLQCSGQLPTAKSCCCLVAKSYPTLCDPMDSSTQPKMLVEKP